MCNRVFEIVSQLQNRPCIGAVDYAKTNDFVSAGLLYFVGYLSAFSKQVVKVSTPHVPVSCAGSTPRLIYLSETLPFLCHVESEEEITDPAMWYKANPSLQYRPTLMWEIKQELGDYLEKRRG